MSQLKKPIKPRQWSATAKSWLGGRGTLVKSAQDIGISLGSTLSCWHMGHQRTPAERVPAIIALAAAEGVTLSPADVGRPDLERAQGGEA